MSTLATYHRTGAAPKIFKCTPGEAEGTVDLLDADGEIVVGACPVIADPETAGRLPDGYATIDGESKPTKAPKLKAKKKIEAEGAD